MICIFCGNESISKKKFIKLYDSDNKERKFCKNCCPWNQNRNYTIKYKLIAMINEDIKCICERESCVFTTENGY